MVKPSGFNATRRNRHIGTKAQGFKHRNAFDAPAPQHDDRLFYERLNNPVICAHTLESHSFTVLIEPVFANFYYYLSVNDILETLKLIPQADREAIKVIVLRQPKRKERLFKSVWGRLAYWADYGAYSGTSLIIEAVPRDFSYRIDKSVGPAMALEIESLRADGHQIKTTDRHFEITCPPEAIRNTQLFRTVPHEIGHNVDYLQKVDARFEHDEGDYSDLRALYFARPQIEREHFADRYAQAFLTCAKGLQTIPFAPIPDEDERLNPDWFYFACV